MAGSTIKLRMTFVQTLADGKEHIINGDSEVGDNGRVTPFAGPIEFFCLMNFVFMHPGVVTPNGQTMHPYPVQRMRRHVFAGVRGPAECFAKLLSAAEDEKKLAEAEFKAELAEEQKPALVDAKGFELKPVQ